MDDLNMIKYNHKLRTNESNKNKNSNALTSSRKKGGTPTSGRSAREVQEEFNRKASKFIDDTQKRVQQAATYIGRGLSPEEFNIHYQADMAKKKKVDKNFRLTPEQIERLTRRNSRVIFNKLSSIDNSGDIRIDGIGYDCKTSNYGKDVWGTLTTTANFVWQNKTGALEWLANMNNFFPAIYKGEDTYLIQDAKDMRPPGIPGVQDPFHCFMLLPTADYSNVRKINISGGIRRTRHNRKYKNKKTKKTKKMRKTKKSRK